MGAKQKYALQYLFTLVAMGRFKHIRHTFPVQGHSFLPNDCDFSRTELAKHKHESLHHPVVDGHY